MANAYRGEIEAEINGQNQTLVLTLGALAELETRLGVKDLEQLGERLGSGSVSSRDVLEIIRAGLIGGGATLTDADIATLQVGGGPKAAIQLVAELLTLTFQDISS